MDDLPAPVAEVVDAINQADSDRFVAAFTEDGVVDDWGRRFEGRDAIRGWSDREAIGAGARMTPTRVVADSGVATVTATWASSVFNGESDFIFTVAGDRVAEMRIPPH
jgi:ketosteroid isomerase-like protein